MKDIIAMEIADRRAKVQTEMRDVVSANRRWPIDEMAQRLAGQRLQDHQRQRSVWTS